MREVDDERSSAVESAGGEMSRSLIAARGTLFERLFHVRPC